MSLELASTVASIGTFVVIAATAVVAMIQLQQLRNANKIQYIQAFLDEYEGPVMGPAFDFVRYRLAERLKDPTFREELHVSAVERSKHPEIAVLNFFDKWGLLFRDGVIERDSFLRGAAGVISNYWTVLEPVIALTADPEHGNLSFQDFEYLTVHARRWLARHPHGRYPAGEERIPLPKAADL